MLEMTSGGGLKEGIMYRKKPQMALTMGRGEGCGQQFCEAGAARSWAFLSVAGAVTFKLPLIKLLRLTKKIVGSRELELEPKGFPKVGAGANQIRADSAILIPVV